MDSLFSKIKQIILSGILFLILGNIVVAIFFLLAPIFSLRARLILVSNGGPGSYYGACLAAIGVMLTALLVHQRSLDEFHIREQREKDFRYDQILEARKINFANQRSEFSRQLSDIARQFGSKEPIVQASAVTGILLQIDAWYQLEELESDNIRWERDRLQERSIINNEDDADYKSRIQMLIEESRRKRQELFYLAFRGNVEMPSIEFFLARSAGFKERIRFDGAPDSFSGLSIDGVDLGALHIEDGMNENFIMSADLSNIKFRKGLVLGGNFSEANFSNCIMREIRFGDINLAGANLSGTDLFLSDLRGVDLSSSIIDDYTILFHAIYDSKTGFPENFDPRDWGMRMSN